MHASIHVRTIFLPPASLHMASQESQILSTCIRICGASRTDRSRSGALVVFEHLRNDSKDTRERGHRERVQGFRQFGCRPLRHELWQETVPSLPLFGKVCVGDADHEPEQQLHLHRTIITADRSSAVEPRTSPGGTPYQLSR